MRSLNATLAKLMERSSVYLFRLQFNREDKARGVDHDRGDRFMWNAIGNRMTGFPVLLHRYSAQVSIWSVPFNVQKQDSFIPVICFRRGKYGIFKNNFPQCGSRR